MHADNPFIDNGCNWQDIENIYEILKNFQIASSFALVIKPVESIDIRTLMIASQHKKRSRVLDFKAEK